jgi:hypothetical protein
VAVLLPGELSVRGVFAYVYLGVYFGLAGVFCYALLVKLIRRRPYLEIDETGITSRASKSLVPWSQIREVRITHGGSLMQIVPDTSRAIPVFVDQLPISRESLIGYMRERNPDIVVAE